MGTETLPDSTTVASGLLIKSADFLTTNAAMQGAFVGRNTSGVPTSGQSLGTSLYPWGNLYANALTIGGATIDVSEVSVPSTRIVSGRTTANSGQPAILQANGAAASVKILATTTDLVLSINSTTITISADITESSLSVAPSSNNTCAINDSNFTDQDGSKYFGEIDGRIPYITLDAVGSEISSLVGQWISLKTDTNEIMFGWLKSATELTNVYRGFYVGSTLAPIVRETLIDDEVLTLLKTGWIFVDDDGSTVDVTYTSPVYAYTAPSGQAADDYWYDITNSTWKRYSGAAWVAVDRIPLGLCVQNTSNCIATRSFDFYGGFKELNTLDCEVFSDTVVRSGHQSNKVNVYGTDLTFENTAIDWDNTADMASGSVANDTEYYLYLSTLGDSKIDAERPYDRPDLRGKYHPYENWRFIAKTKTDGAADWISVIASSMFDRTSGQSQLSSEHLVIDSLSSGTVPVEYDKLILINREGKTKTLFDGSYTVSMATDIQGGELASHWYDWWIDSHGKMKLTPQLTGTADGTTADYLVDSANTFVDYSVFKGATVRNTADNTETTVSTSPTASGANLALDADIFASGETYEIHLTDPVGLDSFAGKIGKLYNDSGSDFTKSWKYGQARITSAVWNTVNGSGSGSTHIQRFTTETVASDNIVVIVLNSDTTSMTVTANMHCRVVISYTPHAEAAVGFGISMNSTELTTNYNTITTAHKRGTAETNGANASATVTWGGQMKPGDIARPHYTGASDGSGDTQGQFSVIAVEII